MQVGNAFPPRWQTDPPAAVNRHLRLTERRPNRSSRRPYALSAAASAIASASLLWREASSSAMISAFSGPLMLVRLMLKVASKRGRQPDFRLR
jgi:hypothetical protein